MKTRLEQMLTRKVKCEAGALNAAQAVRLLRKRVRELTAENHRLKSNIFFS